MFSSHTTRMLPSLYQPGQPNVSDTSKSSVLFSPGYRTKETKLFLQIASPTVKLRRDDNILLFLSMPTLRQTRKRQKSNQNFALLRLRDKKRVQHVRRTKSHSTGVRLPQSSSHCSQNFANIPFQVRFPNFLRRIRNNSKLVVLTESSG